MDEALRVQFATLGDEVQAVAIPDAGKQTAMWCLGQLPTLYDRFQATSESRYGEEITRLVQGVLKELGKGKPVCPEARLLATAIPERFRALHEQLGLPRLELKVPGATSPRSRKVG